MITYEEWLQVCKLLKNNLSIPQIARQINRSAPAIYSLLRNGGPKISIKKKNKTPKKIEEYKEYIQTKIDSGITNCSKLYLDLKNQGYKGSYNSLYRYFKTTNIEKQVGQFNKHYETAPGQQAQVDWGTLGKINIVGHDMRLYCFVYVLGYSRALFAKFVLRQDLQTFQRCHIDAFNKLGIPKTVLYDNIKTVVIRRDKTLPSKVEKIHFNLAFLDFANYYNFKIDLCPPYWPRSKGKVEAGVKYIKSNFVQGVEFGKKFSSLDDLNSQLTNWLDTVANVRIHKTTAEKPITLWEKEKASLSFADELHNYEVSPYSSRNSTKDGMVQYKSNFYSIPMNFSRRKLLIKEINKEGIQQIEIYHEDEIIATHTFSLERGKWIIKDEHLLLTQQSTENKVAKRTSPKVFSRPLSYYDNLTLNKNG